MQYICATPGGGTLPTLAATPSTRGCSPRGRAPGTTIQQELHCERINPKPRTQSPNPHDWIADWLDACKAAWLDGWMAGWLDGEVLVVLLGASTILSLACQLLTDWLTETLT